RRHRKFALGTALIHAHDAPLALYTDAFSKSNLGRESQSETDRRSLGDVGIQVKGNAPSTHIADLGNFALRKILVVGDTHRYPEREPSGGTLFRLGLGHASSHQGTSRV